MYQTTYSSPLGLLQIISDQQFIYALHMKNIPLHYSVKDTPPAQALTSWLDAYFQGDYLNPSRLPLQPLGTSFQKKLWALLGQIPPGQVTTYGILAQVFAKTYGYEKMSPQAVGSALGKNPLPLVLPCHRVIGTDKSLKGYAYGLKIKKELLKKEGLTLQEGKVLNPIFASFDALK